VRELDKINNVDIEFDDELEAIIANPVVWAETQAQRAILDSTEQYLKAKQLGRNFWDEVRSKS
tara:strand:+ start:295 stop:483 length:189 start_codon:yes stop_codon:yes gene_type:complete